MCSSKTLSQIKSFEQCCHSEQIPKIIFSRLSIVYILYSQTTYLQVYMQIVIYLWLDCSQASLDVHEFPAYLVLVVVYFLVVYSQ